jgi:hypothetical protein
MTARRVFYVAHPLSPTEAEIKAANYGGVLDQLAAFDHALQRNLERALRWLAWLRSSFPAITFIAPWIATIQSLHGDDSPEPISLPSELMEGFR